MRSLLKENSTSQLVETGYINKKIHYGVKLICISGEILPVDSESYLKFREKNLRSYKELFIFNIFTAVTKRD
jgi:hypothetical protein